MYSELILQALSPSATQNPTIFQTIGARNCLNVVFYIVLFLYLNGASAHLYDSFRAARVMTCNVQSPCVAWG